MQRHIMQNPVPPFIHALTALPDGLAKAKRPRPNAASNLRLSADLFPLARQAMIATDHAKGGHAVVFGGLGPR
jgi:hypothetical protein